MWKVNKGFTLVELLGVILILGLLTSLVLPVVTKIIKNSKKKANDTQVALIIDGARNYATNNDVWLPTDNTPVKITLQKLIDENYIEATKVQDVETKKDITNTCVKVTNTGSKFTYEFINNATDCNAITKIFGE